jgi:tetratricopeptide (TPR) repeat protein
MIRFVLFLLMVTFSFLAFAKEEWSVEIRKINYKDSMTIPPFCRINNPDPRYKHIDWKSKYGQSFTYINHYCDAKAKTPICYRYSKKEKKACLAHMLEGSEYGIHHTSDPNYPLLPLLYTERGVLLRDMEQYEKAIESFNTALKKNDKYMPAYSNLAETYIRVNDLDQAEKVINRGLKIKETKSLLNKLNRLKKINKQ